MTCPKCKLENPPNAAICDCGYSFQGSGGHQETHYLRSIAESVDSIRKMLLLWMILTLVGAVVYGIIVGFESSRREDIFRQLQK